MWNNIAGYYFYFHTTIKYIKGTVWLRPQIAQANRGGQSYTQSVVKPLIIKLQQYNNTIHRDAKSFCMFFATEQIS